MLAKIIRNKNLLLGCQRFVIANRSFHATSNLSSGKYFPINDDFFGLTDEQKQLRSTVFNFFQKELAPKAQEIDQTNTFKDLRVRTTLELKNRFKLND